MENIPKQLYEVYAQYRDFDFLGYYKEIAAANTNNKYSKGLGFHAGLYEPSYVMEMRVTNCTIGKEVKRIDNGYDYKYYFDEQDRILLSEKYVAQKFGNLNFYFYSEGVCEYILYDVKRQTINALSISYYDDLGRITRYLEAKYWGNDFQDALYEEQVYRYEDDKTYITETEYKDPSERFKWLKQKVVTTNMMIEGNMLYYLDEDGRVNSYYPIRFKIVDGKKVSVPLPKKVPVFKIIKENMINILSKWKDTDKSVIWILCESTDLVMQYTTLQADCEEKWNIAFYETDEEEIFTDKRHVQVLEDLLFNNGCDTDDLINGSDYFVSKMIRIVKDLRKEGCIPADVAVIVSALEISDNTINIAKKINQKEIIRGFCDWC